MKNLPEDNLNFLGIGGRLHVTICAEQNESTNQTQVVAGQGQGASQAAARTRIASSADLGTRYELTSLQEGSTSAVARSREESSRKRGSGFHRRHFGHGHALKRAEIWAIAGANDYSGKPRPVVIVQDDQFDVTASITVCPFTTNPTDAPLLRLPVQPSEGNGLREACRLMVDKITTVPRAKVGKQIGRLAPEDMGRLNRALLVFLGIAAPNKADQLERS